MAVRRGAVTCGQVACKGSCSRLGPLQGQPSVAKLHAGMADYGQVPTGAVASDKGCLQGWPPIAKPPTVVARVAVNNGGRLRARLQ
ncbi:hypothetical protein B296_00000585 [Ensete ventricosum]|uniref:Uncharacterized protein n=1 Tax=Ensete ventricosum TaxID=4639 RepID=A0A426ZRY2_ENSVE|nr:hypothetical protein B296_00000585 [Ensete ventricosum]